MCAGIGVCSQCVRERGREGGRRGSDGCGEMEVLRGWDGMGWVVGVCAVGEEKRKKEEVVSVIKEGCEGGGVDRAADDEEG